ncbi:hypothetical protein CDG76_27490 [Nostoc sp. 'Peltigera membranacea cyanobiont' 210A]|uniref:hypothetical protein n=1 Tax=Nostoc sp. 'Peltigera membranacea cyanobiont' 210A TaxID=2014529 RepID=UPI000B956A02|nr:hypothetical protein [Nostoc sp. 'Peltigera membranacea cyanobiont' 210A]OYD91624.1 hypothetical protein CDG76_27490 [Nostoc sp. 'Peltigera membranacea cyanobiont' 210A]
MYQEDFGADFDNKPQLSLSQPSKKKIKPHLPAESVGKRYVERFWHPFGAIVAPSLVEGTKPAWRTIDYYLQPSQLWNLHQDKSKLVGLRFNDTTRYATIDLDLEGDYHNIESINRIKAALEDIGIVDIIILQSSFSGGYHLILSFASPLPTFPLACALEITLRNAGFILRQGHLEIFPNTKPYSAKQITNYKAIRCPMQPGSGSFLLNDDLQPISDSVSIFLDYCDRAASRQDLAKLKRVANKAKKQISRERYRKQESADVVQWRANWEEIISTGWTGKGQTNTLLQIFVGYGIVFLDLESDKLVEFCLTTAINAPGYSQYCRHQHEIEARVRHWVESTSCNKWYSPYQSYPERLLGTFANTFAEAIAGISSIDKPKDNVIPFDRRKQQNWERSQQAQKRIQIVVRAIEWDRGLPAGATERGKAIRAEYKRRFHKTISQETLQKHLHLWHPTRYILDPWAENSSNPYQSSNDGQFDSFENSFAKQSVENPYQKQSDGHFYYMKVFCNCLPPAADAPTGQLAVASFEEVAKSERELFVLQVQDESEEIKNSEELNLLQPEDLSLTSGVNNSDNSLVSSNIIELAENLNESTSDKNFKYLSNPSTVENYNNKNLLINSVSIPPTASTPAIVLPEALQKAEVSEQSTSSGDSATTLALSELKNLTKLRLQAASYAKRVAREYCLIARCLIGGKERERLEQSAKMQFYLDSGNKTLITEANEWAAVNPGCLPFSLELAFQEGET